MQRALLLIRNHHSPKKTTEHDDVLGTCTSPGVSPLPLGGGDSVWETAELLLTFRLVGRGAGAAEVGSFSLFSGTGGAVPTSTDARRSGEVDGCRPLISIGLRRLFILFLLAEPSLKSPTERNQTNTSHICIGNSGFSDWSSYLVGDGRDTSSKGAT